MTAPNAVAREIRCSEIPDEWKERLNRQACPVCGKERWDFDGRHRGYQRRPDKIVGKEEYYGGTPCCSPICTKTYWSTCKTWNEHRRALFLERGGKCESCGEDLYKYPEGHHMHAPYYSKDWVLDHIVPIAMGGSMWNPKNHQILCEKCNKEKTARDMGRIAQHKRLSPTENDPTRQVTLSEVQP